MHMRVRDYTPWLREAMAEARAAGLGAAADRLEQAAFAAVTTSSELLQEQGLAVREFLKATRGQLPAGTKAKLDLCLAEIDLASPGWRRMFALLRRRRDPLKGANQ